MKITIQKNEVKKVGEDIINLRKDFGSNVFAFSRVIEKIEDAWKGNDATKYISSMRDRYVPDLTEFSNTIEDYGNFLKQVPEVYEAFDEAYASKEISI